MSIPLVSGCTRRRAPRWGILAGAVGLLIVGFMYLKNGSMPMVGELVITRSGDGARTMQLPFALPRLLDPFVAFLPATLLAGLLFEVDNLFPEWDNAQTLVIPGAGLLAGLFGGMLVAYVGLTTLVALSAVAALITLVGNRLEQVPEHRDYWALPIAALMVWLVCTLSVGTIPGFVFAFVGLATASAVYAGVWYFFKGLTGLLRGPVYRALISCPVRN